MSPTATGTDPKPTGIEDAGAATIAISAIGARVKALREGLNLSLRELSERSGVSAATLSQVERGESSPTLAVAARIADGLELSLSQLLRLDEDRHLAIVRAGSGRRRQRRGHTTEELTPPLPGQRADVSAHTLAPGAATGASDDPPVHEPGSRETLVIVEGAVELWIDGEAHLLEAGDSATFDADLPHHLSNPGPDAARLIGVIAAGLRRS